MAGTRYIVMAVNRLCTKWCRVHGPWTQPV